MYTAFPFSLRAGQVGVLTFSAGAGATLGTIEGAIFESDPDAPDAPLPPPTPCVVQGNVLYIPPLPVGLHLFEVRVGGRTAVYQHVEVQPSPLDASPGSAAWDVEVSNVAGEWHFDISAPVGPAGAPGAPGKSAYDVWIESGNVGSQADFLDSLRGPAGASPSAEDVAAALIPMISAELAYEGPAAANNWHASYFQLGENFLPQSTALFELGYRVRFDSLNGCTTDPVYLGVWELAEDGVDWELRGVSLNTQVQAQSTDMLWQFEPAKVRLSGRPIRCCLMETPEDGWRTDLTMGMRVTDTTAANTAIFYNGSTWQKVPKYFLRGYKPAENIGFGGGGSGEVDQSYAPESEKAQSGKAVAEGIDEVVQDYIIGPTLRLRNMMQFSPEAASIKSCLAFAIDGAVLKNRKLQAISYQSSVAVDNRKLKLYKVARSSAFNVQPMLLIEDVDFITESLPASAKIGEVVRFEYAEKIAVDTNDLLIASYDIYNDLNELYPPILKNATPDIFVSGVCTRKVSRLYEFHSTIVPDVSFHFGGKEENEIVPLLEHEKDTTAHLTEAEHAKLTTLLKNGGNTSSGNSSGDGDHAGVDTFSVLVGPEAYAGNQGTAVGFRAIAKGFGFAFGCAAMAEEGEGVLSVGAVPDYDNNKPNHIEGTVLKILDPNSEASRQKLGGEAGLAYSVRGSDFRYMKLSALFDLVEKGGSGGGATTREIELPATLVFPMPDIENADYVCLGVGTNGNYPKGGLLVAGVRLWVKPGLWDMSLEDPQSWTYAPGVQKCTVSDLVSKINKSGEEAWPSPVNHCYTTGKITGIHDMYNGAWWDLEITFETPIYVSDTECILLPCYNPRPFVLPNTDPQSAVRNSVDFIHTTDRTMKMLGIGHTLIVRE